MDYRHVTAVGWITDGHQGLRIEPGTELEVVGRGSCHDLRVREIGSRAVVEVNSDEVKET